MNSPSQFYHEYPVLGNYHLLDELGRGGMGRVYHAVHRNLKKNVALKIMSAELADDVDSVRRFYREMESVGQIENEYLVRAHDAGEVDGVHYLVMELLEGSDLGQLIKTLGPLTSANAAEVIRHAALGLQAIEQHGMIHRDIKVSNLFLTKEGVVKILDLGLARSQYALNEELTPTGQGMGTVDYMSPEQARNAKGVDIRSDIYSLGCTLFKLLSGKPPYGKPEFSSVPEKLLAHCHEPVPELPSLKQDIPDDLCLVLKRMMAKDVEDRYQHATEVIDAIMPFTDDADLKSLAMCITSSKGNSIDLQGTSRSLIDAQIETVLFPHQSTPAKVLPVDRSSSSQNVSPQIDSVLQGVTTRWRKILKLAMACFLIAGGWWFIAHFTGEKEASSPVNSFIPSGNNGNKAPVKKSAIQPKSLDDADVFAWTPLLETEPAPFLWLDKLGTAKKTFDLKKKQLSLSTNNAGMVTLGETHSVDYQFQVGVRQHHWSSGLGMFFGLHQTIDKKGSKIWKYQAIQLQRYQDENQYAAFRLKRTQGWCYPNPQSEDDLFVTALKSDLVPDRLVGEQTLRIEVSKGHLVSVKINGTPLPRLVEESANSRFNKSDYQGMLGVSVTSCDAVFLNAQFKLLTKVKTQKNK